MPASHTYQSSSLSRWRDPEPEKRGSKAVREAGSTNLTHERVSIIFTSHLSNSLALDSELLHLREVVVKRHDVCDDGLLIWVLCEHIYRTKTADKSVTAKSETSPVPRSFFSTRLKAYKHLVLHEGTASISHSPSGSNSLVTPSFCSATLKAFWRLWVGLDLFRLLYSTRSGLREEYGESKREEEKKRQ